MEMFLNLINVTVPTGPNGNAVYMIFLLLITQFKFKLKTFIPIAQLPNIRFRSGNFVAHQSWS